MLIKKKPIFFLIIYKLIKIFLHILIVPIRYESGKVKKDQSNKIGITIYVLLNSVIGRYYWSHDEPFDKLLFNK